MIIILWKMKTKAYKIRGVATDGSITRTVVGLTKVYGETVVLIYQYVLCDSSEEWPLYDKLFEFKGRSLIKRIISIKLETFLNVWQAVNMLMIDEGFDE